MKQKLTILAPLFFLVLLSGSNKAFSQCRYVTIGTSNDTTFLSMPCSFPVYERTGQDSIDRVNYANSIQLWNQANPTVTGAASEPVALPRNAYVEIPISVF